MLDAASWIACAVVLSGAHLAGALDTLTVPASAVPPVIDAALDDAAWDDAARVELTVQTTPGDNTPATERTAGGCDTGHGACVTVGRALPAIHSIVL